MVNTITYSICKISTTIALTDKRKEKKKKKT